ncbi:MAG: phosphatidate cytidylyltransferase [Chloroflexi bacterium]|nr:phosphatidate cytidylyltransferase [Chloroflexota bacterium]
MILPNWFPSLMERDVLTLYAVFTLGLLLVTFVVLLFMQKIMGKNVASLWNIVRGWLIMLPLVFVVMLLGRVVIILGVSLLSLYGFREFARATGLSAHRSINGIVYLGILAVAVSALMRDQRTGELGAYGFFMALPTFVVGLILIVPVLQNRYEGQLQPVALGIMGFIYFGWMFGHLGFLANSTHADNYLLYLVFAVELNDVTAFNFGRLFGRHKLRDQISPNKTVEGALGALGVSMCLPWLLSFSLPLFSPLQLILSGLIVGIGGQLGDLTISFIKRDVGIKDMGTSIPGHGGLLDRIDSLVFVASLFFHMTRYFRLL